MAYLENNSTETLLLANQEFLGATVQIPADFIAAQVSFNTAGSGGTLEFLHSYNGINFQTYGDSFNLNAGEHSKQVSLKAQFFRVKYINGGANQTNFHLHTRIGKGGAFDDMNVITSGGSGGGSIVQIQDSNGNPLLGTDSALNVNIVSGGSGGGIIQGANLDGGAGIEITADARIEGTETINRLYTHSSLYAQYTDGFGVKTDLPLNTDVDGILNVNVVGGGDTFDGVIKGISTGSGNPAVSFSADSFTPAGGTAINKLYTRSSLFGSDEVGEEHEVRVNLDGQVSVLVENPNPLQTEVTNDVIVSPIVQSQSFNLSQNTGLYADSTGDLNPPFQKSPRGVQGWYYINGNATKSSNVYYYFNIPALPLTLQNDILLTDINFVYAVITLDYVGTNYVNLPFLVMGSQALGTNDHIPNFANTTYAYTLPIGNTYIAGEPILIYWSDSVDKKPVDSFLPNVRRIKLNNPVIEGTGESTILAYFSINTGTQVVEKQEYTLMGAGYKFNNTGGEQSGIINSSTFDFLFTAQTLIENNLSKLTFTELNELTVSSTGGGGGGGLVQIQAFDSDAPLTAVNLQATAQRLLTDTNIIDPTTPANKLKVNGDSSLDVHCFGSSDGTTFHHLKTTGQGNLITESKTHDGSNNPITSTEVAGTPTKRGLDVNIIGGGGGGSGGVVQGVDSTSGLAVDIKATAQRLLVDSNIVDAATPARKLVINTDGSINVVGTTGAAVIRGSLNNIHSGTLGAGANSAGLNINNEWGNESVISYEDTSTTVTAFISVHGSFDNTTFFYIGVLQPVLVKTTLRQASAVLKLKGLKFIRITNEHTATVSGIRCTLFSGE
jgi:hypothetical protein